ncbi:MAG: ABC transporter permease [Clostridia bacterium]
MMHNPIFASSIKRRMRSFHSPLIITLYGVFLLLVSMGALSTLYASGWTLGNLRAGIETYIYLSVMQFTLIVLVAPALTAGSIAGERERQTLDLLLCTRMGALRIVVGKLLSSLVFLLLLVVSSLPMMGIVLLFGGVTIGQVLRMLLLLSVTALACASIGIFCSAFFKRTVTATVVAYLTVFALGAGTLIVPFLLQQAQIVAITESTSVSWTAWALFVRMPKLFYFNPALGLLSLIVEQTGIMNRTFSTMGMGMWRLYSIFTQAGSTAWINMAVLTLCVAVLTPLAALGIKPMGRKARKR